MRSRAFKANIIAREHMRRPSEMLCRVLTPEFWTVPGNVNFNFTGLENQGAFSDFQWSVGQNPGVADTIPIQTRSDSTQKFVSYQTGLLVSSKSLKGHLTKLAKLCSATLQAKIDLMRNRLALPAKTLPSETRGMACTMLGLYLADSLSCLRYIHEWHYSHD